MLPALGNCQSLEGVLKILGTYIRGYKRAAARSLIVVTQLGVIKPEATQAISEGQNCHYGCSLQDS